MHCSNKFLLKKCLGFFVLWKKEDNTVRHAASTYNKTPNNLILQSIQAFSFCLSGSTSVHMFSHSYFFLCQGPSFLMWIFMLCTEVFCWQTDSVGWRVPVSSASCSQTSLAVPETFVPTYSLCSCPKPERGEHKKPPLREECEDPPRRKNGAFHLSLFPYPQPACCSQRHQTGG